MKFPLFPVFSCVLLSPAAAFAASITGVTDISGGGFNAPSIGTLAEDADAFSDRVHEWNGSNSVTPNPTIAGFGMTGADYVLTANNARSVAVGTGAYEVTLDGPARVWLAIDTRATVPGWVGSMGFTSTGFDLGVDENGDGSGPGASIQNNSTVYTAVLGAGTHTFNGLGHNGNNYGIIATTVTPTSHVRALTDSYGTPTAPGLSRLGMADGALAFSDRTHIYRQASGHATIDALGLTGHDLIQLDNDARSVDPATAIYEISLFEDSRVVMLWDNRHIGAIPSWVTAMGFADTGDDIGIDESANGSIDQTFSLLETTLTAGNHTFNGMGQASANNYGLVIIPEPATTGLAGLAAALLFLRRRR